MNGKNIYNVIINENRQTGIGDKERTATPKLPGSNSGEGMDVKLSVFLHRG